MRHRSVWEQIWEQNSAKRLESVGMQRNRLARLITLSCTFKTRWLQRNVRRLAHSLEVADADTRNKLTNLVTNNSSVRHGFSPLVSVADALDRLDRLPGSVPKELLTKLLVDHALDARPGGSSVGSVP